jgi:rhodanese-related sulfurtransferase
MRAMASAATARTGRATRCGRASADRGRAIGRARATTTARGARTTRTRATGDAGETIADVVDVADGTNAAATRAMDVVGDAAEDLGDVVAGGLDKLKSGDFASAFKAPEGMENVEIPDFKAKMGEFKLPEAPKFEAPSVDVGAFKTPELPKFDAQVEVPEIDFSGATNAMNAGKASLDGQLKGATDAANALQSGVTTSVNDSIQGAFSAFKGVLPDEFAKLVDLAKEDTDVAIALGVFALFVPTLAGGAVNKARGYAGTRRPAFINDELEKNKRAFLIDTRSFEDRKVDGVPDLRKGARDKGAAVPVEELDALTRRVTANPREVELQIAGERVLKLTKRGAQIYFMGPDAAALAKVVTAMGGRKCFTVEGNFDAWRSTGLKIRRNPSYDKNILDKASEETAELARSGSQFVQTRVGTVRATVSSGYKTSTPVQKGAVAVGFVALAYAAVEWEKTLAFIGFLGLFWSLYNKLTSYESPGELFADASKVFTPAVATVGRAASSAVMDVEEEEDESPMTIELPTLAEMSVPEAEGDQEVEEAEEQEDEVEATAEPEIEQPEADVEAEEEKREEEE